MSATRLPPMQGPAVVRDDGADLCEHCRRHPVAEPPRWADDRRVCAGCFRVWLDSPEGVAFDQVSDALDALERDPGDYLRFPFPSLQRITSPLAPGKPYYVAAFSGNGKTTFTWSLVDAWTRAGIDGYVLPLETRADEWRTGLACTRLGINPALALSGALRIAEGEGDERAAELRRQIRAELTRQHRSADADVLHVSGVPGVTLNVLKAEVKQARQLGCRYLLIDHIDHVEPDDYRSAVAESQRVNRALVRIAADADLVVIAMSQLNMDISKGDGLSKYRPPRVADLMFPAVKNQVAAGIVGLYRPVDETADPDLLARAKRGEIEPGAVLRPNTMGVVAMKVRHQHGDAHEGARCLLRVHQGRVEEPDASDRADYEAERHGIAVSHGVLPLRRPA